MEFLNCKSEPDQKKFTKIIKGRTPCNRLKKRWFLILLCFLIWVCYSSIQFLEDENIYVSITRRNEELIKEQLKFDKGRGCFMPYMDPFGREATLADREAPRIICNGTNWVKCYKDNDIRLLESRHTFQLSKCKIIDGILNNYTDVSCVYRDIIYKTDFLYDLGPAVNLVDDQIYHLRKSDHVNVTCTGFERKSLSPATWSGNLAGFRSDVTRTTPPKGREGTVNILIFAFDSSARIRFIRRMPKTYKYLTEVLEATILNSYNIVGDGTKQILTAMLTGKSLYELPDTRPKKNNKVTCDMFPFIFYKLKEDGYRTAFLEDGPDLATYQWDSNGFQNQPTDHYTSSFNTHNRLYYYRNGCLGDTPQHKIMMDLNLQFMCLDGKKFLFTLVGDISHNDYNLITNADEDFVDFLKAFKDKHLGNTLLLVMGDHGPRFGVDRNTPQAFLEERLPLMAVVLPEKLKAERPGAILALQNNVNSLTTPYDIHATLLDVVGLREYSNTYKVPGADYPRGMTILEPIPANRSCSEAGISPHFCACLVWHTVSQNDGLYKMAAEAFVNYVNIVLQPIKSQCQQRTLAYIKSVETLQSHLKNQQQIYKVRVAINPGASLFEATLTYLVNKDVFHVNEKDVSRTSSLSPATWSGNLAGFRSDVTRTTPPKGREGTVNILIFAFDSSARIRFIRRMPKTYKYLTEVLEATILNSYNIVGDGTKQILTAMLTGKSLYELPDTRPKKNNKVTCDMFPFIFYKLKEDGYRTAFLEDGPDLATYQWDSNGFQNQPTDHYTSSFNTHNRLYYYRNGCLGDTPQHKIMMDLNLQFMRLDGKKFIFTLVGDISHNDYNLITNADEDFVDFLKAFKDKHLGNTLLLVMGDHGPRFGVDRNTPQAFLEERLPLMAVVLPEKLKAERPGAILALQKNVNSLTTPYDIHATLLDVVGLGEYSNNYKVPRADYPRGMTILEPIPANRSCSEAGISPHFCACLVWHTVSQNDRLYKMAAEAFVKYVNIVLQPIKSQCQPRTLAYIKSVETLQSHLKNQQQIYKVRVAVNPGESLFEGTLTYLVNKDVFHVNEKDVSRTSRYGSEPACIAKTHPHLRYYCFCYV